MPTDYIPDVTLFTVARDYVEFVYEYLHQVDRALLLGVGRRLSAKLERIADGQLVCISKFVIDILHSEDYDDFVISATIFFTLNEV